MYQSSSSLPKSFYLDRLGNMSTSSSSTSSGGMGGASIDGSIGCRKQILTLKPKQSANGYVQHLEFKEKEPSPLMTPQVAAAAPVTMLALKKKEKSDKNVVTMLAYRKPASSAGSTSSASSAFEHHLSVAHQNHLINMHHLMNNGNGGGHGLHRPSSPNSSGYDSDSLVEQENCDVFTSLLNSASYAYNNGLMMMAPEHIHHDMLHSHPVWSPQVAGNGAPNGTNNVSSPYFHRENENKFLVQ